MPQYQLRPVLTKRHWLGIIASVLAALFLPTVLNAVVPTTNQAYDDVRIAASADEDGFLLVDAAGEPLRCKKSAMTGFYPAFDCDDFIVTSGTVYDSEDQNETLRRLVRAEHEGAVAGTYGVIKKGNIRVLDMAVAEGVIGVSLETTEDSKTATKFAVLRGKNPYVLAEYASQIITKFSSDGGVGRARNLTYWDIWSENRTPDWIENSQKN